MMVQAEDLYTKLEKPERLYNKMGLLALVIATPADQSVAGMKWDMATALSVGRLAQDIKTFMAGNVLGDDQVPDGPERLALIIQATRELV
jgi:hypothetical protein